MEDIFKFWAPIDDKIHPQDRAHIERLGATIKKTELNLRCLPVPYMGKLKTAPVVLLWLNPGFSPEDVLLSKGKVGRDYHRSLRSGECALPAKQMHVRAYQWRARVTKQFGLNSEDVEEHFAFLNMVAYHSPTFNAFEYVSALKSSRVAIDWAQSVLFPDAEKGKRVVICMRSNRRWGLARGKQYGTSLYAASCTRGGIMHRGKLKDAIVSAVLGAINKSKGVA